MKKNNDIKAFTLLELMVSIFITIVVIASFYKLYDASTKTERTASVRVSVNMMAEQMSDTIAEAIKMIALNSGKTDHSNKRIITNSTNLAFSFSSPYGSPVTKLVQATGNYPECTFTVYNSASLHDNVQSLNLHTQYGVFVTARNTSGYKPTYSGTTASFTVAAFATIPVESVFNPADKTPVALDSAACSVVFPAGTLITGEDSDFSLEYTPGTGVQSLSLKSKSKDDADYPTTPNVVNFQGGTNVAYSMPNFLIQYLKEYKDTDSNDKREWVAAVSEADRSQIKAVRFGFVIVSEKDRVTVASEKPTGDVNKYCIFNESECYTLKDPNKTVSVFRRVVDLVNYRLLEENL